MKHELALILDFATANSQQAAKIVRGLDIYCEVLPASTPVEIIAARNPKAIILQRGGSVPAPLFEKNNFPNIPVLDLQNFPCETAVLKKFLVDENGFSCDWDTAAFVNDAIESVRAQVGDNHILLGLSGGVDSSVCALLLHKAVGRQLTCVFVDHGFMRLNEPRDVADIFGTQFGLNLVCVDARDRFLNALKGVTEPEQKRAIIGEEFIRVFEEEARKLGRLDYFAQGTIYPDIIESGKDGAKNVKSHHNVGGLPARIDFKGIVEPVRYFFKDEVRKAGVFLGLPPVLAQRQPFPGPGLAVRCIGELTRERLDTLRGADAIFCGEIQSAHLPEPPGQYFAVLTGNRSVGVTDGARTYGHTIALRAVNTRDFMHARAARLPYELLERVVERITREVPNVNRVVYDITSKPPATIEWE